MRLSFVFIETHARPVYDGLWDIMLNYYINLGLSKDEIKLSLKLHIFGFKFRFFKYYDGARRVRHKNCSPSTSELISDFFLIFVQNCTIVTFC